MLDGFTKYVAEIKLAHILKSKKAARRKELSLNAYLKKSFSGKKMCKPVSNHAL